VFWRRWQYLQDSRAPGTGGGGGGGGAGWGRGMLGPSRKCQVGESQFLANYLGKLQFRFLSVTNQRAARWRHRWQGVEDRAEGRCVEPCDHALTASGLSASLFKTSVPDPKLLLCSWWQNVVAVELPSGNLSDAVLESGFFFNYLLRKQLCCSC